MTESLEGRLAQLRRRVRQVVCLYGFSCLIVVLFGATLLAGSLDWLIHIDDPGTRLLFGLVILGAAGWVAWRFLFVPLTRTFSNVDLALKIERRYPGFNDSLASTVQFADAGTDARFGSPALQRQVIDRTLAQVDQIDVSDVVATRPVRRIALAAMAVCVVTALVVGFNQAEAATALHRLLFPFASTPWPRVNRLQFLNADLKPLRPTRSQPLRYAVGTSLDLYVEDANGRLPDSVRFEYRIGDEEAEPVSELLRRTTLRDQRDEPREVFAAGLPVRKGPVFFRAVGGDDATPWFELHAVPPPIVESLQLTVIPPAYSGQPPSRRPSGSGHVEGLIGTRVEIEARASKSLGAAKLRIRDAAPQPIEVLADGRGFRTSFEIAEAGVYSYWFDLQDRQGFENAEAPRYEIRGIADTVPDLALERPDVDLSITPDAQVPLRIVARDDLELAELALVYRIDGPSSRPSGTIPLAWNSPDARRAEVDYEWNLAEFSLQPGTRVLVHAEGTDRYDLGPPHVGQSLARTLTVISTDEKNAELAARATGLVEELERVLRLQSRAHEQVGELRVQLDKAGSLRAEDFDLLKRIELDQRQISSRLLNPSDGIETRARAMLDEMRQNRVSNAEMQSRLEETVEELQFLQEENLAEIERQLTEARKAFQASGTPSSRNTGSRNGRAAENPTPPSPRPDLPPPGDLGEKVPAPTAIAEEAPKTKPSPSSEAHPNPESTTPDASGEAAPPDQTEALRKAAENQSVVIDSLAEIVRQMGEWRDRQQLASDLREIVEDQKDITKQSAEQGRETLAKRLSELTPQQQADLARLAERQQRHADRLTQFRGRLNDAAQRLENSDSSAAETIRDAAGQLRDQATAGRMREAAADLAQNNIGEAASRQQKILEELNDLQETLEERSPSSLDSLVKQLKAAEQQLETLRKREESLQKQLDDALVNPDAAEREQQLERLRREQQQVRKDAESMVRRLRRLDSRQSAGALRRAAGQMEQAEAELQNEPADPAEEQIREALENLDQAQRELARDRRQAEERLARELLEKIADELKSMIARQQGVVDETLRLKEEYAARGNWTRAQLKSLLNVADVQRALKGETDALVEKLAAAEVFALALRGAARQMQRAADRLADRKADDETLAIERAALARFQALVEALNQDAGDNQQEAPAETGTGAGEGPPTDGIPQLAQLKMLKTLQEELLRRTSEIDAVIAKTGETTPDQQTELDALALEQGELADLTRNLIRQFAPPADAEPDQSLNK